MIMLLAPGNLLEHLNGMELLQTAMEYHMGRFGTIFIVAYLFGDNWLSQTLYKVLALMMLFIGGLAAYTFVWDLGDIGIGLMTIFNMIILIPQSREALDALKEYEQRFIQKKPGQRKRP